MKALTIKSRRGVGFAAAIIMLAAAMGIGSAAFAAGYSKASIKGTYVFYGSGLSLYAAPGQPSAGPRWGATLGKVTFDGDGHYNGEQTITSTPMEGVPTPGPHRAAGEKPNPVQVTCKYKFTGTYEINADGTGTATSTNTSDEASCGGSKVDFSFVAMSGGRTIHSVSTGIVVTDPSAGVFASNVTDAELTRQ